MQKLDGKICDVCRTMFYPGDHVIEMCEECANTVWCVFNVYENGSRELSSIHRTEEKANNWVNKSKELLGKLNLEVDNKIIKQEINSWYIL